PAGARCARGHARRRGVHARAPSSARLRRSAADRGHAIVSAAQRVTAAARPSVAPTGLFDLYRPRAGFVVVRGGRRIASDGARALEHIESGRIEKVVLSRALLVESDAYLQPKVLARRLRAVDPECFVFTVALPDADSCLIGASPELLVRRSGSTVVSEPLAGT